MPKRDTVFRFAVGEPKGARGVVWRVWVSGRDASVYVSSRELGGRFKVSLHPSQHLAGPTAEEAARIRTGGRTPPRRAVWSPDPDQFPGFKRIYMMLEPMSEVVYRLPYPNEQQVRWLPLGAHGQAIEFQLWRVPVTAIPLKTTTTERLWKTEATDSYGASLLYCVVDFDAPHIHEFVERFRSSAIKRLGEPSDPSRERGVLVDRILNDDESFLLHIAVANSSERPGNPH